MIMRLNLLPPERVAIAAFVLLFATTFLWAALYRWLWFVGPLLILAIWFTVAVIALFNLGFAFRDPYPSWRQRLRAAAAIPLAISLVLLVNATVAIGPRVEASVYLKLHASEMERAEAAAAPSRPAVIPYVEGVPDGGQAILRSERNPMLLAEKTRNALVDGDMRVCRRIIGAAWLCSFG